ncbi:MAG: tetratricopeptide repeat protein, partial [Candidatus Omnitrophica bacterium]|nr:tetratricopeptide repeat protein [Candidatus Omnitrophota bacterium]
DESLETYKKALELRPRFPEAREYLGEAYIKAALREIKTLKGYGVDGEENLEDLVKAFKEAAAGL